MRGQLRGFSVDRLLRLLTVLGQDVDIVIHSARPATRAAQIRVAALAWCD